MVLKEFRAVDNLQLVQVPAGTVYEAIAAYRKDRNVLYAEPDFVVYADDLPNDPDLGLLWGMYNTGQTVNGDPGTAGADIRAPEAWDLWTGDAEYRLRLLRIFNGEWNFQSIILHQFST